MRIKQILKSAILLFFVVGATADEIHFRYGGGEATGVFAEGAAWEAKSNLDLISYSGVTTGISNPGSAILQCGSAGTDDPYLNNEVQNRCSFMYSTGFDQYMAYLEAQGKTLDTNNLRVTVSGLYIDTKDWWWPGAIKVVVGLYDYSKFYRFVPNKLAEDVMWSDETQLRPGIEDSEKMIRTFTDTFYVNADSHTAAESKSDIMELQLELDVTELVKNAIKHGAWSEGSKRPGFVFIPYEHDNGDAVYNLDNGRISLHADESNEEVEYHPMINVWTDGVIDMPPFVAIETDISPIDNIQLSNTPNPFNPKTTISFSGLKESIVKIDIFSTAGKLVKSFSTTKNSVVWNGVDLNNKKVPSGAYFCRLSAGNIIKTKTILLLK